MKTIDFDIIDSTNTYIKNNYQSLDNMTFVSAKNQTNGRGRNQRIWKSEDGRNLLFSLLLSKQKYIEQYKAISILSAYTVLEVLEDYGINASIKWPNDVYVNDSKICGILLEAVTKETVECLIVGIGINVNQKVFEGEYLHRPTSLSIELNKDIGLDEFKLKVYTMLENNLNELINGKDFYEAVKKADYLRDKEVYAVIDNLKRRIRVIGINEDYSLKIEYDNITRDIESGEITFHL